MRPRFVASLALAVSALAAVAIAHPHFSKSIEVTLGRGDDAVVIGLSHLTVTFNKEGFEKSKEGDSWHLGGASFETTDPIQVGGKDVANGKYRLLTRKTKTGDWELMLDPGGNPFDAKLSERAIAVETKFESGQPVQEHLRLDLQPSGDKQSTALFLEAHFDHFKATAKIALPAVEKPEK